MREAEGLAAKIQTGVTQYHTPLLPDISTIAYLAHHAPQNIPNFQWQLCSVGRLVLKDVDLASVPAQHLASLASCVKFKLQIINVRTTNLVNILDNIKCEDMVIKRLSLGSEESLAMVRAMESTLKIVELHNGVNLHITTLTQYSGHGKCERLGCYGDTGDRYREEVRSWGQRIKWSLQETGRKTQIDSIMRNRVDSIPEFVPRQPNWGQNVQTRHVLHFPQQFSIQQVFLFPLFQFSFPVFVPGLPYFGQNFFYFPHQLSMPILL